MFVGGEPEPVAAGSPPVVEPSVTPSPLPIQEPKQGPWRGYALALPEVDGLPPDLQAGDTLELWVAWDPPLTKEPEIAPLIERVLYDRTIPPVLPGDAPVVVLLVPEGKVERLMYGDRYGALSAVVVE